MQVPSDLHCILGPRKGKLVIYYVASRAKIYLAVMNTLALG